jgi:para-nitrobenzyl esterase
MKPFVRALLLAIAIFSCAAAFGQIRQAQVTGGRVAGSESNGVVAFKGIPFAAPPVGALRWKAPQPVHRWSGVRDAASFAPACLQAANPYTAAPSMSEDCLYLNVWTPAKTPTDQLPVMVWIYGGAFAAGATSTPTYDGAHLATKGVVVVSVAYRLGPFGFLAHPDLTKESGKGSGNYGLLDQIAGLKWVKENIAKFGGDAARVTVFGESAGGIAVSMLTVSPYAKGLFQRAISESGGNLGIPRTANEGGATAPTLKVAEAAGQHFLATLGADDIDAARRLPADKVLAAVRPSMARFWPVFDGDVLPGDEYRLYEAGRFNDTPILVGTNSDEGNLFVRSSTTAAFEAQVRNGYGQGADAILAAYPHATDTEATRAAKDLFRDSTFAWGTAAWARLQSQHGHGKAFVYYFDHRTPQSPNGSNHAAELGYVFGTLGAGRGPAPTQKDEALSELMMSYWTNFAKTGDPNGSGLPDWPAFRADDQRVMAFDGQPGATPLPNADQLRALGAYFAWRRGEAAPGPGPQSRADAPPVVPAQDPAQARARQQREDATPDTPGTGPYPAIKALDPTLPDHVIYRPANLAALGKTKLGVYVFGNGGCTDDGASARLHLEEIASHGYVAIAPGGIYNGPGKTERPPPPASADPLARTSADQLTQAIDWALAENKRRGSAYFRRINPTMVAVAGYSCGGLQALAVAHDPRVATVVILNSGVFNDGPRRMGGVDLTKAILNDLHTPTIYILGGPKDIAYANGMDDFARIDQVPVAVANIDTGHGGTYWQPSGGAAAEVAVAWLDWRLRGDAKAGRMFLGKDCGLCADPKWTFQSKRFDELGAND